MSAIRTARQRARAEVTQAIKDEARRQLGTVGPAGLSLRAVARELGMASSAIYRYFASRDALLTALIVDAYDAAGDRIDAADREVAPTDYRGRWRACYATIRAWAGAAPHEYALVFGSPVPGYQAPADTVGPASRIPLALIRVTDDAWSAGALVPAENQPPLPAELTDQARTVAEIAGTDAPAEVLTRTAIAWTQLFGMISFELFGHLARTLDPATPFFDYTVEQMADFVGLP